MTRVSHFPVVRLRGLPFDSCEKDIYDFFLGFDVVDVLLVHKKGRFSGEAYVVFGNFGQVSYALQKHRHSIRHRYIEIFLTGRYDYYQAVAAEVARFQGDDISFASARTGVLRLRGLPFSASRRDIVNFFKEFKLRDDAVHLVLSAEGRATGEAFVEFPSISHCKAAMDKDKMILGDRYIELFPVYSNVGETSYSKKPVFSSTDN
ncbi:hypothetical protein Mapa_005263 [Marchantia paleacea]|nr:hypothetical protein Mapa_005263 [Marchantia paleacea]